MDKSKIPVSKIKLSNDFELEVYDWLTYDESKEMNSIMLGDFDINPQNLQDGITVRTSASKMLEANMFLVEHICKNITKEEFNVMSPKIRDEIIAKINERIGKSSKK